MSTPDAWTDERPALTGPGTGVDGEPQTPAPVDQARIERAVRELLLAIGEDPERDGLLGTPASDGDD